MSGHKRATITISEDEYRRLHDAEMKLRFMPRKSAEPTILHNQVQEAVLDHLEQVRLRQDEFHQMIGTLNSDIRSVESITGSAIIDQQVAFAQQLSTAVGDLWQQAEELLAQQATRFDALIVAEHQARQDELMLVQQSTTHLETSEYRRFHLADQWLQAAEEIDRFICDFYCHQQHAPGAVNHFETRLRQAIDNLADGAPEAALMQAQQVYLGLSELRIELEKRENEWNALYQAAWEGVSQMLEIARSSHTCAAHDLDGEELPVPIDVDYWSCGGLSRAIENLEDLALSLQPDVIGTDELSELLNKFLPQSRQTIEDAIYQARLAVLNSQLRINIADLVIEALQSQGYALQQAEYARNDQRMAYSAKVRNLEGNEIVIQVSPGDVVGKNELHLVSLDREQRTEHELRRRSLEVTNSLGQHGLIVDNLRSMGSERYREDNTVPQRARIKQVQTHPG
jgi:hypothetical protein